MPEPLQSRTVFEGGWIRVDVESWPGLPRYEVVRERDAAAVLPLTPEDALSCAARELFEETGYRHETIEFLGGFYSCPGSSNEYVHLFLARTAGEAAGNPEPGIEVVREPFDRIVAAAPRRQGSRRQDRDGSAVGRGAQAARMTAAGGRRPGVE